MKDNSDMKDKYALVTGAAKGIGKSSVLHLAKAGINVAINYRSSEKEAELLRKEVEALGVKSLIVKADVGDVDEVKNMAKAVGIINNKRLMTYSNIYLFFPNLFQ